MAHAAGYVIGCIDRVVVPSASGEPKIATGSKMAWAAQTIATYFLTRDVTR